MIYLKSILHAQVAVSLIVFESFVYTRHGSDVFLHLLSLQRKMSHAHDKLPRPYCNMPIVTVCGPGDYFDMHVICWQTVKELFVSLVEVTQ